MSSPSRSTSRFPIDSSPPLRPQASPRNIPFHPPRSSSSSYSQQDRGNITSGAQTPSFRGRSPIVPWRFGPGHVLDSPNWADVYGEGILFGEQFSTSPDEMSESIFEPQPVTHSNLAEMLAVAAEKEEERGFFRLDDEEGFAKHRDTFAIMGMPSPGHHRAAQLPDGLFRRLAELLDFESYLSVRLVCRCWSAAISIARLPRFPAVFFLPAEIIHQIYNELAPVDFNAARHTCRFWMLVSLNRRLLEEMLERGGWSSAAQADAALHERSGFPGVNNKEWLLSKRLATECSLQQNWTGTGSPQRPPNSSKAHFHLNDLHSPQRRKSLGEDPIVNTMVEFSADGHHDADHLNNAPDNPLFAVSICSRYLLVADDCIIYIYGLGVDWDIVPHGNQKHVNAIGAILCPYRVLAISMDTSLGRFAVAALLEGRVGLVCELEERSTAMDRLSAKSCPLEATSPILEGRKAWFGSSYSLCSGNVTSEILVYSPVSSQSSWIRSDQSNCKATPLSTHEPSARIKSGPRTLYRNLCSIDDPPQSVAICPQRRCVAFGCSTGVELHWIDALTNQPMNRWFPLADPSDFLYFLPGLQGTDGKRKLRLVSSKAHPSTDASIRRRCYSVINRNWYGDHWWRDPVGWDELRIEKQCHHRYQTVPVSDGRHVLFTDSLTGLVSLGFDAAEDDDEVGGTRLKRRFVFQGPSVIDEGGNITTVPPRVYKAALELRWGVRVVVGFANEDVWCFSVPGDWFSDMTVVAHNEDTIDEMDDDVDDETVTPIPGVRLGAVRGLREVGVWAGGGGVSIWGCGRGRVKAWAAGLSDVDGSKEWKFWGGKMVAIDGDGDVVMEDWNWDEAVGLEEGNGESLRWEGFREMNMMDEGYFSE